ncbi:hypothetical protein CspeluHIS016_0301750 [Cutaneotrichosporon spelunceum]|uniref:Aldehyde dehydrogenase domain-containing protein n=1 Tax=Cutaneotrichosporon spelunceum TaxID=1672016 RepID=A0AAD3TTT6_9TREE|nr:hypothetical protein CspeluHIS016_0301750 [Cutaneotrichosporon spelunceum]
MSFEAAARAWLSWLSALTLGQIWAALCNPPDTPWKTALVVAAFIWTAPEYYGKFKAWHRGRKRVKFVYPAPKEAATTWHGEVIPNPDLFSHTRNHALLPSNASGDYITCYDPSSGEHIETRRLPSAEDIARQVARADAAQPKWARTTFAQRASVLRSIKAWILRDMDSIVAVACRDTGKTRVDAVFGEILTTLAKIDWLVKNGEKVLKPERRALSLLLAHKISEVHYEPLGTVLACVSWNYSFHNALSPILAALMAGDAIVVKCSEQVAWSSDWFINGVKACLRACGHNADIIQLAVCLPAIAETLTTNPTIRHVTFIGSEPVGRKVASAAASILAGTTIELGGKDPAFILPSADMKFFASTWMRGAFQSAGQNCIGVELFLVPRARQDEFIDLLLPRVKALRVGTDVGALISHAPIARLERLIKDAEAGGARILAGGKQYIHADKPEGAYFAPTLLADVSLDMELAREELFAPVMTVVPYDDIDETLAKLRTARFGLGGSVYGAGRKECMHVAQALQCGMVSLNDFGVFYLNQDMPFGGVKASGYGRFAGPEGLRGLCYPKAVIEDRFFSLVRTSIPAPVDFPLPPGEKPWVFLRGLVFFAYGAGVARVKGLLDVIRMAVA